MLLAILCTYQILEDFILVGITASWFWLEIFIFMAGLYVLIMWPVAIIEVEIWGFVIFLNE